MASVIDIFECPCCYGNGTSDFNTRTATERGCCPCCGYEYEINGEFFIF